MQEFAPPDINAPLESCVSIDADDPEVDLDNARVGTPETRAADAEPAPAPDAGAATP